MKHGDGHVQMNTRRLSPAWSGHALGRVLACLLLLLFAGEGRSDITPDGTLGSVADLTGQDYSITGGTQLGSNLFHSFSVFDIHTGESATFNGPTAINNIISRVTGGSLSTIDGALGSSIAGANLYLLNPAGVLFGPNATLNVDGSFHVSTANYLVLGSDGRFDVSNPGATVLTTAPPSAFGYIDATAAPITLNGSFLEVPDGETLSVIGGDIEVTDASLYASGGQVNVVSTGSAGEVHMTDAAPDTRSFSQLGDIQVIQTTFISERPTDNFFPVANIDASGDGGGAIYIRGEQLVMDNGYVFADTLGGGSSGLVDVAVRDDVILEHEARITADTGISTGNGGDIVINATNVKLRQGGQLSAATFGPGSGGSIEINASGSITLDGKSGDDPRLFGGIGFPRASAIVAETFSSGQSGTVTLNTAQLTLDNESLVSVSAAREGDAGSIVINSDAVDVLGGSAIASGSGGSGTGGSIDINVSGAVRVAGARATGDPGNPYVESGIRTNTLSSGDGGSVTIDATEVLVTDRGVIQANLENKPTLLQPLPEATTRAGQLQLNVGRLVLLDGGQIVSANLAGGIGGDITVKAGEVSISGQTTDGIQTSGIFSVTASAGPSGNVVLTADTLDMDDLGSINTSTLGSGAAGDIRLLLQTASLQGGARIISGTGAGGDGGLIEINASGEVTARGIGSDGSGSGFYSDVQASEGVDPGTVTGTGGNIELAASSLRLHNEATVSAKSTGVGDAGSININTTKNVKLQHGATITTQSVLSGGGRITISTRDLLYLNRSSITSSVQDGSGNGGDITIDPQFVVLLDSQILAQAFAGNGGNISITAGNLFVSPDSIIDASSQLGIDGDIVIDSPDADITDSTAQLPADYLDVTALLHNRCAARAATGASSLIVQGKGGVPPSPAVPLSTWGLAPANDAGTTAVTDATSRAVALRGFLDGVPALLMGCAG